MAENKISIEIPDEEYQSVLQHVEQLQSILKPYLISLTVEQRRTLPKLGDKTLAFVNKAVEYANNDAKLVPSYMDLGEWKKDVQAYDQLTNLYAAVNKLLSTVDDTTMLCGSEAYTGALSVYDNAKQAAKANQPNAKPVVADLAERFPGRINKQEIKP
ncbi:hypothetical protein [Pedobacter nototheniae]|uniref:hypothetical protein n=1 Tax=Pedobacter nototheniae TaxID=2488994 RepID=UPI001039B051|nr:hypothetical protein [Pedobacter nototheniae]